EQGSGSSVITPVQDDSQADGTAVFVVKSTKAEIVVYTVKVDGATQGATVAIDFVPGLAESLIVEAAGSQKAGVPFNVTVTAKDLHGNTATGYRGTVELTSMDSQAVLPGSYAFSETDQGTYIFNGVILKTSGSRIITAEDIDNDSIRGATGNITVGPDTESGQSTIAADKPVVIADSKDKVNITVTLRDVYGNPVRGKTVNLSQGSGISVVEAVYGTSSHMDGTVLFTVASTKAETVKYTAMVDEKAVTEAVEVTFLSGTAAQLEWEIQPGGGSAGQIWPQQPVLVLKDSYGNVNTGDNSSEVTVVLKYGDEAILGGTKTVTFKNGEAIFNDLQIDTMGSYKLTPTITMNGIDSTDSNIFRISLVPAPSIKPNGGTFSGPVTVGLDYPEEYEAYYSLDEKTPNQDAIFYDGPFTIFSNSTVSATVCDTVYGEWSQTSRAEFIIQLSTPTADVEDGSTIENKSTVKLSAAVQGATIYYTTDGSTPNTNSSSGNIVKIIGTEGTIVTLKAYAVKADYKESKVVEFRYFIKQTDSSNNDGDNDSTGDSSSGDSGGSRTPAQGPQTEISFVGNVVTATKTVTAAFDSRGNTMATVSLTQVNDAIGQAQKEAERLGEDTVARVEIKVEAPADATAVTTNIPQEAVSQATVAGIDALKVVTPIAVITFDANALSALAVEVADEVKIRVSKVDASSLSLEAQQKVGDRPILDVNVNSGGRTISQFGGDVFVSLPYAPKAGEDTEAIVIYYINALGDLEIVSDCLYDPVTGRISFSTRHFSQYAVGYNKVTFKDVTENAWYSKAVGFIAAREITLGTGDGKFSPDAKLTRGTFMVMLLKAYGIAPDRDPKDNFADAGDTYYTGYLAVAKRLKISAGVGDNMFAPCEQITRQEMFTLLYNALKSIGRLPEGKAGEPLSSFADVENVASWAKEAMTLLAETGTIGGNEGKLSPTSTTTRAEMAQVLYNLLHHHPQTLSFFVSSSNVEAVTLLTRSEVSCK
ncbi:MAG: S-layer homology domain-containing protein, partial [Peptostreptococcales bacterium]